MRILLALLLALSLTGCAAKSDDHRLPDLTLPSMTGGKDVRLGDLRGPLVVNVWASWCAPCRHELPYYAAFARKHAGRVDVLGIDWRNGPQQQKALAMLAAAHAGYPNVRDDDGRLPGRFLPKLILVDAHGKVVLDAYRPIKSLKQLEGIVRKHLGASA